VFAEFSAHAEKVRTQVLSLRQLHDFVRKNAIFYDPKQRG